MDTAKLVLLRHGQSDGNREGYFSGQLDVDLTPEGVRQAYDAGELMWNIPFGRAYTSALRRARRTCEIALQAAGQSGVPIASDRALNERFYGDVQGMLELEIPNAVPVVYEIDKSSRIVSKTVLV